MVVTPATVSTVTWPGVAPHGRPGRGRGLDHLPHAALAHALRQRSRRARGTRPRARGWRAIHAAVSISDQVAVS